MRQGWLGQTHKINSNVYHTGTSWIWKAINSKRFEKITIPINCNKANKKLILYKTLFIFGFHSQQNSISYKTAYKEVWLRTHKQSHNSHECEWQNADISLLTSSNKRTVYTIYIYSIGILIIDRKNWFLMLLNYSVFSIWGIDKWDKNSLYNLIIFHFGWTCMFFCDEWNIKA